MNKVIFLFCWDSLCVFILAFAFLLFSSFFLRNTLERDCSKKRSKAPLEQAFLYTKRKRMLIARLSYFIPRIACHLPWPCRCLAQARACAKILDLYKIPYSFHLGVRYGKQKEFLAHAWVECNDIVVVGGSRSPFLFSDLMR